MVDYETVENRNLKKVFLIEWVLTIEFMKIFIKEFIGDKDFYLYRALSVRKNVEVNNEVNLLDSTSLFGPCYFNNTYMENNRILYWMKIKPKNYCCFFNHIINPFSCEQNYQSRVKKKFLNTKLKSDFESEIGYLSVSQEYDIEVKGKREVYHNDFRKYSLNKSIENFKQNILNDKNIKDPKFYAFYDDKVIEV